MRAAVLALIACCAVPVAAVASPQAVQPPVSSSAYVSGLSAVEGADGVSALTWQEEDFGGLVQVDHIAATPALAGRALDDRADDFPSDGGPVSAAYGRDGLIVAAAGGDGSNRVPVRAALGRTSGPLGPFVTLGRFQTRSALALAADARGDAVLCFVEGPAGADRLRCARRRAGHAFGRPRLLARTGTGAAVGVAADANGDVLVAYRVDAGGRDRVRAASGTLRRGTLGRPQDIGPTLPLTQIAPAVGRDGRAVVAWGYERVRHTPGEVRAALRGPRRSCFARSRRISVGNRVGRPNGPVSAAVSRDGQAGVLWTDTATLPGLFPLSVATSDQAFARLTRRTLAPDAIPGRIAAPDGGGLVVDWADRASPYAGGPVRVSRLTPHGGRFGAPRQLSPAGVATSQPTLSAGPAPLAAWEQDVATEGGAQVVVSRG